MGLSLKLIPKQEHAVYYLKDKQTTELLYGGAAGGGKTALGCLWLIEQCQAMPETRHLMGRAKLKTLKETTLNTFFEQASKLKITNQFNYNQQLGVINWDNGSQILMKDLFYYPSDPEFDSLGSLEVTSAFIDEVSQVTQKAFQITKSRIRYKLNENNLIPKILGTCNPTKKWIYKEFYKPHKDKTLKFDRKFIQALPKDNPHLPKAYLESLLSLDETSKQRLYYGNWEYDDDPAKLIEYDSIIDLWTNSFVEKGDKYITADIARFGSDKGVIWVWEGFRVIDIIVLDHSSVTNTAKEIKKIAESLGIRISNVICDEDGVGGGVVDILGCRGFVNGSSPLPELGVKVQYANLKTQCYYKLAKRVNEGGIFFTKPFEKHSAHIIQELEYVKRDKIDNDTKLYLMSKEDVKLAIGRSPDYSDGLMMREWFEIEKHKKWDLSRI